MNLIYAGATTSKTSPTDETQTIRLTHTHTHPQEKLNAYEMDDSIKHELHNDIKSDIFK